MPKLVIMDRGGDMTKTWDEETRSQTEEIFNDLALAGAPNTSRTRTSNLRLDG